MEPNETNNTTVVHKEGSVGPVIGTIIILAVILLGGLYFWGNRNNQTVNSDAAIDAEVQEIETQSDSDDLNSIESDLNNTNYDVKTDLNAS